MTRDRRWYAIIAAVLVLLAVLACGPLGGGKTPEATEAPPTPPLIETPVAKGRCGDGVCDEAERANPALCPQDCAAPPGGEETPEVTETPPPAETPIGPGPGDGKGRCGDGVCDGPENTQNCPQDCARGTAPAAGVTPLPLASGVTDYEPPINVVLILHIDPMMIQEVGAFKVNPTIYARTHDEIDWLMAEAARHGLHFTALYNGWYPQEALKLGDTAQFRELLDAGHEIGSHAHRITYDPVQDLWISQVDKLDRYGRPNYDAALTRQCWADADSYVDTVLADLGVSGQNQTMCAFPFMCSDEGQMMGDFGFTIAAGNRSEKGAYYFGHMVWNPWRPAASDEPGHEIEEDPTASFIAIDHYAQIGEPEAHGMDITTPQLQRRFLMLYAEWLARERTGAEDRVWLFGFVYHPDFGDKYNAALVEFLDWLDEFFIGKTSPFGHTIARYATVAEIGQEYLNWEAAHPGTSSFNYVRGGPYPYTYAIVPTKLDGAAYEAHVELGAGVACFRFSKDGRPIYLLWSDQGERTVNLHELSGQVQATNAAGEESVLDAARLPLTGEPLFVEPLE
jgi:hypothetical protein